VIEDLGAANGTWVNGTRIQTPHALGVGDSVRLGETILLATDAHGQVPDRSATRSRPPSTPTSASPVEQNLELVDGVGVGRRIPLGMEVLIGRSVAEPGRVRDDLDVSRRHAVIRREPQGLTVEDLGSANGTYVNGRRIEGRCRLEPGDRLSVGRTTFAVSDLAGRIPPAPPAPD
jgi:pSer/pThr/pTyr-binding forkhead associated (FHA) protein